MLLCGVVACSCQTPPVAESLPAGSPTAPIMPRASSSPTTATPNRGHVAQQARAQDEVDRVLREVSRLRHLATLGPVTCQVIDRSTMLRQVKQQVQSEVPKEAIAGEGAFLAAFGFIPQDYDYETGVYGMIESELAGYYDPDRKTMFLMEDLSRSESEVTLAHELVHALQDQHYDLGSRLKFRADANDAQAAVHALAEGDATSLMLDFTLEGSGVSADRIDDDELRLQIVAGVALSPQMASVPRVLRDSLVAPYVDGTLFVHRLRRRDGWDAVDRVWRNPPATTEQVLHLDKLDAREPAEAVPVPTAPHRGSWSTVHTDVYGEQGLRIALEDWLPRRVAEKAAAGWAGDRVAVLVSPPSNHQITVAAWHLRFDRSHPTHAEAAEAFDAIASGWGEPMQRGGGSSRCHAISRGRSIALVRSGRDVALVAGVDAASPHVEGAPRTCAELVRWATAIAAQ